MFKTVMQRKNNINYLSVSRNIDGPIPISFDKLLTLGFLEEHGQL
jgi:hypothetical protein